MLTVNVICIGKLKEEYWRKACEEYAKRLSAFCKLQIIELAETKISDNPSAAQIAQVIESEEKESFPSCLRVAAVIRFA